MAGEPLGANRGRPPREKAARARPSRPPAPVALTIAGSDPSGGAGLQADLRAFARFGLWGAAVPTALTVQGPQGVEAVHPLSAELVAAQLRVVLRDLPVAAAKTGMLGTAGITSAVAAAFADAGDIPLIVDPILHATSGAVLLDDGALAPLRGDLLPLTTVLTPNLPEAEALLLRPVPVDGVVEAARALLRLGPRWVVLKGGHGAAPDRVEDVLVGPDGTVLRLSGPRIPTRDDHGTGCLFAACLTADLALGATAPQAFRRARRCLDRALREAQTFPAGRGAAFLRALSRR